jgi:hypothetical protein
LARKADPVDEGGRILYRPPAIGDGEKMSFSSGSFARVYRAGMLAARSMIIAAFLLVLAGGLSGAQAECVSGRDARKVLEQGQAAPLPSAMQSAGLRGAQVLDAQLCRSGGGWSYRVRYRQGGQVRSANIPAG